ncbi:MAG: hypothetical protein RML40_01170 [Bacteroidota bacterium]|nr:hypothetical protein [Bacteroidota bacterium]
MLWLFTFVAYSGYAAAQQLFISQVSDQSTPLNTPLSLIITISDANPSTVLVLGFSDNQTLISDNNIVISQGGSQRQVTISPTPGQSGTTQITIVATNSGGQNTSMSFRVTVGGANLAPSISSIPATSTPAGVPVTIPFTITDANPATVSVTASADNTALVPPSGIVFGGFGSSRTLTITPSISLVGTTVITLVATNQSNFSSRVSFPFTVIQPSPAQAPTITNIPDLATAAGTPVSAFFNVFDISGAQNVSVLTFTSDPNILPTSRITISGTGSSRQITLQPNPGTRGRVVVQLRATNNAGLSASTAFALFVVLPTDPPTIEGLRDTVLPQNTTLSMPFRIIDGNPDAVTITPSSASPDIVPTANIQVSGTGINRVLTITPAQNRAGEAIINIAVRNQNNVAGFGVFRIVYIAPPRIGQIPALSTPINTPVRQSFSVEDANANLLTFQFSSSNPALIPTSNISISTQGLQGRTLTITPATGQIGTATITMTVTNINGLSTAVSFPVTVFQNQTPPSISSIGSITTARNVPVTTMFTVSDVNLASLRFTFTSSNPTVFPLTNILVSGSGTQRILTLTPAPNQIGSSVITVTVTNEFGLTAQTSFLATVIAPPAPPTLRAIVNLTTFRNTPVSLQFVVSDENLSTLRITATSSNQALFPNTNLLLTGTGTMRTITMTPALNQLGVATITLTAINQQGQTATLDFTVTVVPQPLPPTIAPIGNITLGINQTARQQFAVNDPLDVNTLRFLLESSNTRLQPTNLLQILGSGTTRTLVVSPMPNQVGTSDITITVTNSQNLSAHTSFRLTVVPPPIVGTLSSSTLATRSGISTSAVITIADTSGFPLTFSIQSSNPSLVPIENVRIEDLGNNRYRIIATPVQGQSGRARITVTISNGYSSVVRVIDIEVAAPMITPPSTVPILIAPSNNSTGLSPISNRFVWSRVPGALLYQIQIANDSLFTLLYLNNDQLTDTTWLVTEFGVNRQYFWRVRARFGLRNGDWSPVWTFTTGRARQGGLLTQLATPTSPDMYTHHTAPEHGGITRLCATVPNPFSGTTRIEYELADEMPILLQITDALGTIVSELVHGTQQRGAHILEFSAHHLPSGIYWCTLYTPYAVYRQKMLLQR